MKRSLWKLSVLASLVALGFIAAAQAQRGLRPTETRLPASDPMSEAPLWGVEGETEPQLLAATAPDEGLVEQAATGLDQAVQTASFESNNATEQAPFVPLESPDDPEPSGIDFRSFQTDSAALDEDPIPTGTRSPIQESSEMILAQADPQSETGAGGFRPNVSDVSQFDQTDPFQANDDAATDLPRGLEVEETNPEPFFEDQSGRDNSVDSAFPPEGFSEETTPYQPLTAPGDTESREPDQFSFEADEDFPPAPLDTPLDEAQAEPDAGNNISSGAGGAVPASHALGNPTSSSATVGAPDPQWFGVQTSMITIEKTAPASVNVGETTEYEIIVRNTGSASAQNIIVRDEVPRGARLLTTEPAAQQRAETLNWDLGTLSPGQERRIGVQLVALEEGEIGSVARVEFSAAASSKTMVTRPQLALDLTAPEEVMLGDELTLLVRLTNPGTGTATGVMLLNVLPEEFEHPDGSELEYEAGTLAAREAHEVPLTVTASRIGRVRTQVTATGDGGLQASAEAFVNVVAPQLTLTQNGPRRRYLGRPATYTLTVANPGTAAATAVTVVNYLPQTIQFISASDGGQFDPAQGTVTWTLGNLGAGQTANVEVTGMPRTPGEARNFARAIAARDLKAEAEFMTLVEGVAAILLEVVDIDDPIEVGAETSYEIRVINQGSKVATNVRITASVPQQFTILDATGPTAYRIEGDQVVFAPIPRLGPRADTAFRVHVSGQAVGDVRFRVHLATDQMADPVLEEESTRIYSDR